MSILNTLLFDNIESNNSYNYNITNENGENSTLNLNPTLNKIISYYDDNDTLIVGDLVNKVFNGSIDALKEDIDTNGIKSVNNKFSLKIFLFKENETINPLKIGYGILDYTNDSEGNYDYFINVYNVSNTDYDYSYKDNINIKNNNQLFYIDNIGSYSIKIELTYNSEIYENTINFKIINNDLIDNLKIKYIEIKENIPLPVIVNSLGGNTLVNYRDYIDLLDTAPYLNDNILINNSTLLFIYLEDNNNSLLNNDYQLSTLSTIIDDNSKFNLQDIYKNNIDDENNVIYYDKDGNIITDNDNINSDNIKIIGKYIYLNESNNLNIYLNGIDINDNFHSSLFENVSISIDDLSNISYKGIYSGQKTYEKFIIDIKKDDEFNLDGSINNNYGYITVKYYKDNSAQEIIPSLTEITENGYTYLRFILDDVGIYNINIKKILQNNKAIFKEINIIGEILSNINENDINVHIKKLCYPKDSDNIYAMVLSFIDKTTTNEDELSNHEIYYSLNGKSYKKYISPILVTEDIDLYNSFYKIKSGNKELLNVRFSDKNNSIIKISNTILDDENSKVDIIDLDLSKDDNEVILKESTYNNAKNFYFKINENNPEFFSYYIFIDGLLFIYSGNNTFTNILNSELIINKENPYKINKSGWHNISILKWNNVLSSNFLIDNLNFKLSNSDNMNLRKPIIINEKNVDGNKSKVTVKFFTYNDKIINSITIKYMDKENNIINDNMFHKTYSSDINTVEFIIDKSCQITAESSYINDIIVENPNKRVLSVSKKIYIDTLGSILDNFTINGINSYEFTTQTKIFDKNTNSYTNKISLNIGPMAWIDIPKNSDFDYKVYINGYLFKTYKEMGVNDKDIYPIIRNKEKEIRHYRIEVIATNKINKESSSYYYNEFIIDSLGYAFPKLNNLTTYLMNKTSLPLSLLEKHEENVNDMEVLLNNRIIDMRSYIIKKDDEYILTISYYYYNGTIRTSSFYFSVNSNIIDELKPLRVTLKLKDYQDIPYYYDKAIKDNIEPEAKNGELIIDRNTGHLYFANQNNETFKIDIIPITKDIEDKANEIEEKLLFIDNNINEIKYLNKSISNTILNYNDNLSLLEKELKQNNTKLNTNINSIKDISNKVNDLNTKLENFITENNIKMRAILNGYINDSFNLYRLIFESEDVMNNFYNLQNNLINIFYPYASDAKILAIDVWDEIQKKKTKEELINRFNNNIIPKVNNFINKVNNFYGTKNSLLSTKDFN